MIYQVYKVRKESFNHNRSASNWVAVKGSLVVETSSALEAYRALVSLPGFGAVFSATTGSEIIPRDLEALAMSETRN